MRRRWFSTNILTVDPLNNTFPVQTTELGPAASQQNGDTLLRTIVFLDAWTDAVLVTDAVDKTPMPIRFLFNTFPIPDLDPAPGGGSAGGDALYMDRPAWEPVYFSDGINWFVRWTVKPSALTRESHAQREIFDRSVFLTVATIEYDATLFDSTIHIDVNARGWLFTRQLWLLKSG